MGELRWFHTFAAWCGGVFASWGEGPVSYHSPRSPQDPRSALSGFTDAHRFAGNQPHHRAIVLLDASQAGTVGRIAGESPARQRRGGARERLGVEAVRDSR